MGIIKKIVAIALISQIIPSYTAFAAHGTSTIQPYASDQNAIDLTASDTQESTAETFFTPYRAVYSTVYKKGITLKVEGKQTLTAMAEGDYQFDFVVDTLLASLKESSQFSLQEDSLRPSRYHYSSRIIGKRKDVTVTFDWDAMTATNHVKGGPWSMPINDISLDRLTLQLQLRHDLKSHREQLSYDIADGGKLKRYSFEKRDHELIKTKLGQLDTIKVVRTDNLSDKRHQYFWFAPEFDYLLVKMEHFEKGESYTLNVDKVTELAQP